MITGKGSGLQVLEGIESNPRDRDILVAMISARGQARARNDARKRGADAYFVKPFSPLKLASWVRSKAT
jgi:DNA-binding response OmpR family regulator